MLMELLLFHTYQYQEQHQHHQHQQLQYIYQNRLHQLLKLKMQNLLMGLLLHLQLLEH